MKERARGRREGLRRRRPRHARDGATACCADLELALLAGKIAAYAQGFAVMDGASKEFGWDLPLPTIAKIWRAGCIIRSQFLDTIAAAFDQARRVDQSADGAGLHRDDEGGAPGAAPRRGARRRRPGCRCRRWRRRSPISTATARAAAPPNLIQAQRDFFGAHGFERIDAAGAHHGPWAAA